MKRGRPKLHKKYTVISVAVTSEMKEQFFKKNKTDRNKILRAAIKNAIKILPDWY